MAARKHEKNRARKAKAKKRVPRKKRIVKRAETKPAGLKWFERNYSKLPDFLLHFTRLENAIKMMEDYAQGRVLNAHFNLVGEHLRRAPFDVYWEKMNEYVRAGGVPLSGRVTNPLVTVCIVSEKPVSSLPVELTVRSPGDPYSDMVMRDPIPLTHFKGLPKKLAKARQVTFIAPKPFIIQVPMRQIKALQAR